MLRVLFTNTNCSWNKGSAAQVISASRILRKFIPDAGHTLLSHCFELDSRRCSSYGIRVVGFSSKKSRKGFLRYWILWYIFSLVRCGLWALFRKISLNVNSLTDREVLREFAETNVIIDLSGDSFSDSEGGNSIINSLNILIGILLGKPIVIYSQSIGPFRPRTMPLAKFCLNRADLIIVREEITKSYLKRIGVTRPPIYLTADTAFLLEPAPRERVESILSKEGFHTNNEPLIGISTSELIDRSFNPNNPRLKNKYVTIMAKTIDYLIEKLHARTILVPHVFSEGGYDDRFVAKKIRQLVKNKNSVQLITNEYTPEELRGIIGKCDLFIGARMHANISAISMNVPTIAIAWSHKYHGIMKTLGQEKHVCDIMTTTFDELASKINDVWSNREEIKRNLMGKVRIQKKLALFNGKLVKNLLVSS